MTKFKFYRVCGAYDGEFLILCLNLNTILPTMFQDSSDTIYEFNEWG